ncbi:MAG: PIN domain-containing protein [Janthinobacterium lividum]
MYLVDTNVLSATAPTKAVPWQSLQMWMERNSAGLHLSVITVAEVEDGIARSRRTGAHAKAKRLTDWLETVLHLYGDRILPIDIATARRIGSLANHVRGQGHDPGLADLAIAATAAIKGYVVLTRNLRHFGPLGVVAHDPFAALPEDVRP